MRSSLLGPIALVALLLSSSTSAPAAAPNPLEVPRVLTGNSASWFGDRYALALEVLAPNVPAPVLLDVTLSIMAQWAHESARGRAEFNFNMGGWRARAKDRFFVSTDIKDPGKFHWTAYRDLPNAVADQLERLHNTYPTAWAKLIAQPTTSAWVEELGAKGYYSAKPTAYAHAWAMHRAELGRLVS